MLYHGPQSDTVLSLRLMRPLRKTGWHWPDLPHWILAETYPYAVRSALQTMWRIQPPFSGVLSGVGVGPGHTALQRMPFGAS